MRAAKDIVGPGAGLGPGAGVPQGLAVVLGPGAANLTPGAGAVAVASRVRLADLQPQKKVRNVLPQVDPSLQLLLIARGRAQGRDLLTVATEL